MLRPVLLLALTFLLVAPAAAAPDEFKAKLKEYKQRSKDPSFFKRMMAQAALARTKDKRALATLAKEYGRFPDPRGQAQHVVTDIAVEYFDGAEHTATLGKWRAKFARPENAWLWYRTLILQARHGGAQEVLKVAKGKKNGFVRAAAVEALAALRLPQSLEAVPAVLASLPKDDAQRAALINSAASVLRAYDHEAGTPTHHGLARRLMDQLDLPATPACSKVVIARALQDAFDVPYTFTEAAPWRQVLASVQSLMEIPALRGKDVQPVTLCGIKARGTRICYLLDYSRNAAREISLWDEQTIQGKKPDPATAGGEPQKGASLRALAMRQAVEKSIQKLSPEQSFAILYHRHLDTGLLPGTEGFLPATPKNVALARDAMKALSPKHASDLHAGLMHAFALTDKGFAKKSEYIDPVATLQGCDTIFVLSQSGAVADTWSPAGPVKEGAGRMMEDGRYVLGLYSDPDYLASEVKRWNLFRKAQIHAVAIGDAPKEELRDLFRPYRGWGTLQESAARTADADSANELFESVNRQYEAYLRRSSLFMRMRGRRRLAATRDARALDVLARSYARPEAPIHRVPHLLASLCARNFGKAEHLPRLHAWRESHKASKDAWLWFRTLLLDLEHGKPEEVEKLAREAQGYLQLAAIRAVADGREANCVPLAAHLLGSLPPHGPERESMLEATAALLQARGAMRTASDFGAPAEALILQLKDEKVSLRTRKSIARHLAQIFKTDMAYGLDWRKWLRELKGAQASSAPEPEKPPDIYAPTEFIGIPTAGGRICYVVDASDSMLEPITGEERRRLSRVVTGPEKDPKKPKHDPLPWDKIHNRFDVAREYLKISLRKLSKDKAFAIVLFGTDAELIPSTPHLVTATPAAIREVIRNLDDIKPGPKSDIRPNGTLRGFTNMHGGFDIAFRMTGKGLGSPDPYVDPQMLEAGVDTIYLLSDGDPSTDDYRAIDRPDTGDSQADPETRAAQEKVPDVTFYGPYVDFDDFLVDDVRRMNLFRNAAIHCIGFGEANMLLLRELARAGMGETRSLGKD